MLKHIVRWSPAYLLLITSIVAAILAATIDPIVIGSIQILPWLMWVFAGIAYIALSFRWFEPVREDEIGVRMFYGKPIDQVGPGPAFVPIGLLQLRVLSNLTVQDEWPTDPEHIFRGDEHATPPEGQKPPIRVTFRDAVTQEEAEKLLGDHFTFETHDNESETPHKVEFNVAAPADGLSKRVTAEVSWVSKFRINDGVKFIQTVGDIDRAKKQLEDEGVGVLQRWLPLMSVGQALQNIDWINTMLQLAVQKRTENWGIELEKPKGATIKQISFHRALNDAIGDASKADFRAKETVRLSEGTRQELINKGEGAAKAAQDLARGEIIGRAEGLNKLKELLGIEGSEALAAEVAQTFGKHGNATIIDSKTGIAGLAGAASTIFNKRQTSDGN